MLKTLPSTGKLPHPAELFHQINILPETPTLSEAQALLKKILQRKMDRSTYLRDQDRS